MKKSTLEMAPKRVTDIHQAELMAYAELPHRTKAYTIAERLDHGNGFNPVTAVRKRIDTFRMATAIKDGLKEAAKVEKDIEAIRAGKASLAAQSYLSRAIRKAETQPLTQDTAYALRSYRSATAAEAYEITTEYHPVLARVVEDITVAMGGAEKMKTKYIIAGSADLIHDWNPLSAAIDQKSYAETKGATALNPLELEDAYSVLGLDSYVCDQPPESGSFGGRKSRSYTYFAPYATSHWEESSGPHLDGVNLRIDYNSAQTITTEDAKYIPEHVEVVIQTLTSKN